MKTSILLFTFLLGMQTLAAQAPAETAPLPEKLAALPQKLKVGHFPSPVLASTDPDEPGTYFWKHNSTLFSAQEDATIVEGGAYIYYNDQWNLRVSMSAKEFAKLFGVQKGLMKAGQPYTFVDNWRRDSRLYGGWAMWYVIAELPSGERVCGIGKLDTVGKLYGE
ncbi:MAG: hypothetical protein KTR30_24945 [Saprospiraceae bacterium]|nr:hypothetical protein [Saprospiraceae bacterium]